MHWPGVSGVVTEGLEGLIDCMCQYLYAVERIGHE